MIIITSKPGQLGNRIAVYAHFIAFAKEHNVTLCNPSFDEYCEYFVQTENSIVAGYPKGIPFFFLKNFFRSLAYKFGFTIARVLSKLKLNNRFVRLVELDWKDEINLNSPDFIKIAKGTKFLFTYGWLFRDIDNIQKHNETVRSYFKPLAIYEKTASKIVEELKVKNDLVIGMHIRHGDYKTFLNGKYYYTIEEYADFMLKAVAMFPTKKVCFLVCSNSQETMQPLEKVNHLISGNHFMVDMYALSFCDIIMGPPSTFTIWASYYGQKPLYKIESKLDEVDLGKAVVTNI